MERRKFLTSTGKTAFGIATGAIAMSSLDACSATKKVTPAKKYPGAPDFTQKPLGFAYTACEPFIDSVTMEIHFTKHATAYLKNMNEARVDEKVTAPSLETLLSEISKYSVKLRNNAGGHYNHESFWRWLAPGGNAISDDFRKILEAGFSSMSDLKNRFADAGAKRFGSGWAWLVLDDKKQLQIGSTPNQDNPLMDVGDLKGYPLLGLDVWEHAYYLKYQNRRADYINNWWNLVNWKEVEDRYKFALGI